MGLTVSRKTVKNLAVERLYWKMLTGSRKKVNGLKKFLIVNHKLAKILTVSRKSHDPIKMHL